MTSKIDCFHRYLNSASRTPRYPLKQSKTIHLDTNCLYSTRTWTHKWIQNRSIAILILLEKIAHKSVDNFGTVDRILSPCNYCHHPWGDGHKSYHKALSFMFGCDGISDHACWNEVFHYWDTKLSWVGENPTPYGILELWAVNGLSIVYWATG